MIKIALPFLLIGKALKPLAKIKKQSWKAMGNAFNSIKSSVDPMKSFSKIMEILGVVMLPLTFLFTLFAAIILKELMPYIADLILMIDDLGDIAKNSAEEIDYLNCMYESYLNNLKIENYLIIKLIEVMIEWYSVLWECTYSIENFTGAIGDMLDLIWDHPLVQFVTGRADYDGDEGGDGGDEPWDFWEEVGGFPLGGATSSTTNSTVNINLTGAIVDNKAQLINDITEAVIIRIG